MIKQFKCSICNKICNVKNEVKDNQIIELPDGWIFEHVSKIYICDTCANKDMDDEVIIE